MKLYLGIVLLILLAVPVVASDGGVYVARGDPISVVVNQSGGTCWYFPMSNDMAQSGFYDIPSYKPQNKSYCSLSGDFTASMPPGKYSLVYKYPAVVNGNVIPDVSFKDGYLVSIFSDVAPVNTAGRVGYQVKDDLLEMVAVHNMDSTIEYPISIEEPEFAITRIEGIKEDMIQVSGVSNLADGTRIVVVVDEAEHVAKGDLSKFTFNCAVSRLWTESDGRWSCNMPLPMQEMAPLPVTHEVVATAGSLEASARFPIYQAWTPAPTPTQYINYFGNGTVKPDVIIVEKTVVVTRVVDKWHTATPTPPVTDALGEVIEYPYNPQAGVSLSPWIAGIAALLIAGIVMARDWKWR